MSQHRQTLTHIQKVVNIRFVQHMFRLNTGGNSRKWHPTTACIYFQYHALQLTPGQSLQNDHLHNPCTPRENDSGRRRAIEYQEDWGYAVPPPTSLTSARTQTGQVNHSWISKQGINHGFDRAQVHQVRLLWQRNWVHRHPGKGQHWNKDGDGCSSLNAYLFVTYSDPWWSIRILYHERSWRHPAAAYFTEKLLSNHLQPLVMMPWIMCFVAFFGWEYCIQYNCSRVQ